MSRRHGRSQCDARASCSSELTVRQI
jgi:hypothetical protein